ncbi:MAG TPA: hypothetical protein ENK57_11670 [Polyangiaceae bacterium]|nr:hypothetical protein [Polyangiaceae bacterium]
MTGKLLPACLAAAALAQTGCRAKEDEERANGAHVAATSEADATTDVTDEALGFVLHHPGPGWKLLHREDASALSGGAVAGGLSPHDVVGLVHAARLDGALTAHVERVASLMPLTERKLTVGAKESEDGRQSLSFDVAGNLSGVPLRFIGKAIARGELVYDVVAWAPAGGGHVAAESKAFLEAFELRGKPRTTTIPASAPIGGDRVGEDFTLRGGVYRDFRLELRMDPPEGFTASAGSHATAAHPDARLLLRHDESGLVGLLVAKGVPDGGAQPLHEQLIAAAQKAVALEPGPTREGKLGGADAFMTEGRATVEGQATRYRLASVVHGEQGIALWTWSSPTSMRVDPKLLAGLDGTLLLDIALPAVEATTSAYSDHRLGFTLTTPSGWAREDLTPPTLRDTGTLVRWDDDGRWIAVLAAALPGASARYPWMLAFLEQLLGDQLGRVARATGHRGADQLGGQHATRVSWHAALQNVDALLTERDGIAYAVLTVDHDETSYDLVKRSFAFLP